MLDTDPISIALRIAHRFLAEDHHENTYNNQLAYEALLLLRDHIPDAHQAVQSCIEALGITTDTAIDWRNQQFHDLPYAWFQCINQLDAHADVFLQTSKRWISEAPRRDNDTIIHNCKHDPVGSLIDMHQAYILRLARAAALSGDNYFISELSTQAKNLRAELRNNESGCYHQGKGWLENDGLSPGTWSRGQGWILHGMVHCLPLLNGWPKAQSSIAYYTEELLEALVPLQGPSGLWHQLIDTPDESFPDSSGSALILEAFILFQNYKKTDDYQKTINQAWNGLAACVDQDGIVDLACKGPGPIWETEPWRNSPAGKGDPHGVFSMLFACAAMIRV